MRRLSVLFVVWILTVNIASAQSLEDMTRQLSFLEQWWVPFAVLAQESPVPMAKEVFSEAEKAFLLKPRPNSHSMEVVPLTEPRLGALAILALRAEDRWVNETWRKYLSSGVITKYQSNSDLGVMVIYLGEPVTPFWRGLLFLQGIHFSLIESGILKRQFPPDSDASFSVEVEGLDLIHQVLDMERGQKYRDFLTRHAARTKRYQTKPSKDAVEEYHREMRSLFGPSDSILEENLRFSTVHALALFDEIDKKPDLTKEEKHQLKGATLRKLAEESEVEPPSPVLRRAI